MTIKGDAYYGKLSLDKTAELEKRLENKISEDNAEVLYRTVTEEESFTSSPVDNTVVKSLRWNVLKKIGAKVRIVVSIPDDTADVKITLNGKELIPVTVAKTGKTVRADGILPEGLNSAVVTVSGKTSFTATVSVTYTGYFEICREEVRLSYATGISVNFRAANTACIRLPDWKNYFRSTASGARLPSKLPTEISALRLIPKRTAAKYAS